MVAPAMLALIMLVLGLYWLPSIIGWASRHPDAVAIIVVNALLGWTIVGWVRAFTMLARRPGTASGVAVQAGQADGRDSTDSTAPVGAVRHLDPPICLIVEPARADPAGGSARAPR